MAPTKAEWRSLATAHRHRTAPTSAAAHKTLVSSLETWLAEHQVRGVVVVFDALPGEVDLSPLLVSSPVNRGIIRPAITRTPEHGFDLTVHPIGVEMERHRYGYRQPVAGSAEVADQEIQAVLVPALAFDRDGNRLGFGAGYYDRFLARVPTALRIGIADLVVEESLPAETFDIPMTHLATHDGVIAIAPKMGLPEG